MCLRQMFHSPLDDQYYVVALFIRDRQPAELEPSRIAVFPLVPCHIVEEC